MPLIKSGSRAAMSQNIAEMVRAGHPQKQAVAAAYRNSRQYARKYQDGGDVDDAPSAAPYEGSTDPEGMWGNAVAPSPHTMDKLLGTHGVERYQFAPEKLAREAYGVASGQTQPYDPSSGKWNVGPALDVAGTMMGASAPLAEEGAVGMAGSRLGTPNLSKDDIMKIAVARQDGKTWQQIGDDLGMPTSTVHAAINQGRLAVGTRNRANRAGQPSDDTLAKIATARQEGKGWETIAGKLNIPASTVRGYWAKMQKKPDPGYADGGGTPFVERAGAYGLMHQGMIHSPVPGRTDKLPISVSGGAYVVPADHVSAVGQGNSAAGADILNRMFKMGPAAGDPLGRGNLGAVKGIAPHIPRLGGTHFAAGGGARDRSGVPIIAAGGEFVIPPEKVAEIGGGDITKGHKILDRWVVNTRRKHIDTLRNLKPPKK